MGKFNNIARAMLSFRKKNKGIFAVVCILCVFVAIGVFAALITPAVSQEGTTGIDAGGVSWPYEVAPDGAFLFEPTVTSVNVSDEQVGTDSETNQANVTANFVMNFNVTEGSYNTDAEYAYYYYNLSDLENVNIAIPAGGLPLDSDGNSVLGIVNMGGAVGTYRIEENGLIVICFDVEKLTKVSAGTKPADISFSATVSAKEGNNSDDIEIDFNGDAEGGSVTVSGFKYGNVDIEKSAAVAKNDAGEDIITWTLNVNNPNYSDLEGVVIYDEMLKSAIDVSSDVNYSLDEETGEIILGSTTANPVTITYTTKAEPTDADAALIKGYDVYNTADLFEPDSTDESGNPVEGDKIDTDNSHVYFPPTVSMNKTGSAIYGVTEEDNYDSDEITWAITVSNTEKDDLGGFYIKDNKFIGLDSSAVKVTGATGYTFDSETGMITFAEGTTAESIVIEFTTIADSSMQWSGGYDNTASLHSPTNEWDNISSSASVTPNPVNLYKTGTVDMTNKSINWIVEINDADINDSLTLDGMIVDDDMLLDHLNAMIAEGATDSEVLNELTLTGATSCELIKEGNLITGIKINSGNASNVKISYTTDWLMDGHYTEINPETEYYQVDNTVVINKENEITQKTETSITFSTLADTEKYIVSKELSQDGKSLVIKWEVYVKGAPGSFENYKLVDEIKALTDGTTHVFNEGSVVPGYFSYVDANGVIQAVHWSGDLIYYNVAVGENNTSFTYTFDNDVLQTGWGVTDASITELKFTYTTTVNLGDLTADDIVWFENTATSYDKDGEILDSDTVTDSYNIKKDVIKTAGTPIVSDDMKNLVIPWKITLDGEKGTFMDGFEVLDYNMGITINGLNTSLAHSFKDISSIVVNGSTTLTADTDYTVTDNGDGTLTIALNKDKFSADTLYSWTSVVISYNTIIPLDYDYISPGDVIQYSNTAESFEKEAPAEGTYTVVDLEDSISKESKYDSTDLMLDELTTATMTIDGVETEVYLFKYQITVNQNGLYAGKDNIVVTDTLPEGFRFYENAVGTGDCQGDLDGYIFNYYSMAVGNEWDLVRYSIETDGENEVVKFYLNQQEWTNQVFKIGYVTYIPKTELQAKANEGKYSITNTATDGLNSDSVTIIVESNNVTPDGNEVLNKTFVESEVAGYLKYEVDFNAGALDLSTNSDYITLTDYLTFGDSYKNSSGTDVYQSPAELLNTYLDSIKFYEVAEDGTLTEISSGVSYLFTVNPTTVTTQNLEVTENPAYPDDYGSSTSSAYVVGGVIAGSKITLTIPKSAVESGWSGWYYKYENTGGTYTSTGLYSISTEDLGDSYRYTLTVPSPSDMKGNLGEISLRIWNGTNFPDVESATVTQSVTHGDVGLTMSVPDSTHIKIVYQYRATSPEVGSTMVSNNISTESKYGKHYDESYNEYEATNSTQANVYEDIQLEKVDASNHAINLKAGFNIYRYTSNGWEYITSYTMENNTYKSFTFGSTGDKAIIYTSENGGVTLPLEAGYVYYIEEVIYPDGYDNSYNENVYISYATANAAVSTTPNVGVNGEQLASGDIKEYTKNTKLVIQNSKNIEVTVEKTWADGGLHEGVEVTFGLYSSTTHLGDGDSLPSGAKKVSEITISSDESWTHVWTDLPTVDENGNLLFYYVQEENTVGSYTPVYDNNGLSDSGTIEVTNSKGLTVEKEWYDSDGKKIDTTSDDSLPISIKVKLYYSTLLKTTKPEDATFLKEVEIYAANNWTVDVQSLPAYIVDSNGTSSKVYYYVDEVTIDGYVVEYDNNGSLHNGKITIENTKEKETGVTLPSTGGNGNRIYLGAGLMLVLLAAAGLTYGKHRKAFKVIK